MSATTTPTTDDDAFAAAFDKEVAALTPPATPPEGAPPATPPEGATPVTPPEGATPVTAPEGATPVTPPEGATPVTPPDTGIIDRLADLLDKRLPPAPPAEPAADQPDEPPVYTPEEQEAVEAYRKEWGDVARGEGLIRRAEYGVLMSHIYKEVAAVLGPMRNTLAALASDARVEDLTTTLGVPNADDYLALRTKVTTWVEEQPEWLRSTYNEVMTKGSVDQIKDLVAIYRKSTGDGASAATPPAVDKATELPPATKQAVDALAPVSGGVRTVISPSGSEPQSFDDAFDRYAKAS